MPATPSEIQSGCHLGWGCYYKVPMKSDSQVGMQKKNRARLRTGRLDTTNTGVCELAKIRRLIEKRLLSAK